MTNKSVPQETRVSCKSAPQECHIRVSLKSVLDKSVSQECPTRVSRKSGCHARVSHKSDEHECPTRVSPKSSQECPTKVSENNACYKSVPQECLLQECQKLFGCLFSSACVGFVGSILRNYPLLIAEHMKVKNESQNANDLACSIFAHIWITCFGWASLVLSVSSNSPTMIHFNTFLAVVIRTVILKLQSYPPKRRYEWTALAPQPTTCETSSVRQSRGLAYRDRNPTTVIPGGEITQVMACFRSSTPSLLRDVEGRAFHPAPCWATT